MTKFESWLVSVLGVIDASSGSDFAGLGLVFYTGRAALPVHPLVHSECESRLPTKSLQESMQLLAIISRSTSDCHDGFHLIDVETLSITDVSQFLSPPIPSMPLTVDRVTGARHMAARLASLLPGVQLTAVYTLRGEATLYEHGEAKIIRIPAIENS